MSWGKQRWYDVGGGGTAGGLTLDQPGVEPTYFKEAYFAGETLTLNAAQTNYGAAIIPLVCLYKIDWGAFEHDYPGQ